MQIRRTYILGTLAGLTLIFLSTAVYSLWNWQQVVVELNESVITNSSLEATGVLTTATPDALRLTIAETGIAVVSARQLRSAKFSFSKLSAETIRLSRAGKSVPFFVAGEGDNALIYFYAQAITNTMEAPAVYLLNLGEGTAMQQKRAVPSTPGDSTGYFHYRWEENKNFLAQEVEGDLWLGPLLLAPRRWDLSLTDVQANSGPAELSIRLWSSTEDLSDPDHHVEVLLNGRQMASWYWDGIRHQTLSVVLPPGELQPDYFNLLSINMPGDTGAAGEALYIDWIYLKYSGQLDATYTPLNFSSDASAIRIDNALNSLLIFDITDPHKPIVLTDYQYENNQVEAAGHGPDGEYLALYPSDAIRPVLSAMPQWPTPLQHAERGADYLVILADGEGFEEMIQPLLAHREQEGMQVTAVPLSQIYDEFSYGQQSPSAIRRFIAYAAASWQPAPRFVLLVGDATYDLHNFIGGKNRNLLPTAYTATQQGYFVASDAWFTSDVPQLAIGRFPVQTASQLQALVSKTIAYETVENSPNDWNHLALLVADDEPEFDLVSDNLALELNSNGYETHKLYMSENDNIHYTLIGTLNRGVGLVNYIGHGSATMWGDEAVLRTEDAEMLANADRLPIFTTFTCNNGDFTHPQTDSLTESLLWVEGGGIVAAIAPSSRAAIDYQLPISELFYELLLDEGQATVGEVLAATRLAVSHDARQRDVMQTINLLGDPALRLQLPTP
jgi:hypothetical protein